MDGFIPKELVLKIKECFLDNTRQYMMLLTNLVASPRVKQLRSLVQNFVPMATNHVHKSMNNGKSERMTSSNITNANNTVLTMTMCQYPNYRLRASESLV